VSGGSEAPASDDGIPHVFGGANARTPDTESDEGPSYSTADEEYDGSIHDLETLDDAPGWVMASLQLLNSISQESLDFLATTASNFFHAHFLIQWLTSIFSIGMGFFGAKMLFGWTLRRTEHGLLFGVNLPIWYRRRYLMIHGGISLAWGTYDNDEDRPDELVIRFPM
jgi:hypothetical protein